MARRATAGTGTIRKKIVTRNGKEYVYWEARYTAGYDPGTGKQIQRSITGKTQKEVAQKLKEATHEIDEGTYIAPNRMTVGQWLDIWTENYLGQVKFSTAAVYRDNIRRYIRPAIGAVRLTELQPHTVQNFVNHIGKSPRTVSLAYRVLHQALEKAVQLEYIVKNPCTGCELPRAEREEIRPLDIPAFMAAIRGDEFETLLKVDLFTGMRQGEILGLMWSCVDFQHGSILIDKQLRFENHQYVFHSPKSGKSRIIVPAPWVMDLLKRHRAGQAAARLKAGSLWENSDLVFCDAAGHHLIINTVFKHFKKCAAAAGAPNARFHDLRHTYAVASIRAGDDIKTIQNNLGHASAAFTLDVYGHVTERMRMESAQRMENFIKDTLGL